MYEVCPFCGSTLQDSHTDLCIYNEANAQSLLPEMWQDDPMIRPAAIPVRD